MDFKTLYDAIFNGADLEFKYNDKFYFINSGDIDGKYAITVYQSNESFYCGESVKSAKIIFEKINSDANANVLELFNEKLFNGKTLYQICESITDINYWQKLEQYKKYFKGDLQKIYFSQRFCNNIKNKFFKNILKIMEKCKINWKNIYKIEFLIKK